MECIDCEGNNLQNFGLASGAKQFGKTIGQIYVPFFDNDGNINEIDCSVTIDQAFLTAKLNETDASKRWQIVYGIKNIDQPKDESLKETFGDGESRVIEEGVRNSTYMLPWVTYQILGKMKSAGCNDIGVFHFDKCKNLRGEVINAGFVAPQKLAAGTFETIMNMATDSTDESSTVNFQYDKLVLDQRLNFINGDDITADLLNARSIIDLIGTASNITATTVDIQILTDQATCGAILPLKNAVAADFVDNIEVSPNIFNVNDDLPVAITLAVLDASTGTYQLTFVAQVAAEVLEIRLKKDGFEMPLVSFIAV